MTASGWRQRPLSTRGTLIERPHLLRSLGSLLDDTGPRIALVSAPAGFGKTTLCAQFGDTIVGTQATVAWAELEARTNSAHEMWRTILAAIRRSSPAGAWSVRSWPRSVRQPGARFVQRLQDALAELPAPIVLVLDDLETIDDAAAVAQLGLFIRRLPPPLRVVLSTRHDPAFPMHELQLAGQVVEVRAAALAFTAEQTQELLAEEDLAAADVTAVTQLTEGWPAGVQLARALLKQPGDGARLAALFNAQSNVLADYLFNEAFTSQAPRSQDLLLRTSVVSPLSESLAAELTGRPDAGDAIASMVDLAPLLSRHQTVDEEVAYRYHPLLRAYLLGELTRRDRDLLRATHRRAAVWYEHHDDHLRAIAHARASEDGDLVDGFVRRYAAGLILNGDSGALLHTLSEPRLAPTAWEAVVGASAAVRSSDPTTAARWLTHPHATHEVSDPTLDRLRQSVALKLAGLARTSPLSGAPELLRDKGNADNDLELLIALNRCTALLGAVDEGVVERELKDALNLAVSLGREVAELQCRALNAAVTLGRGDFVEAAARIDAACERSAELERSDEPAHGLLRVISGWVAYENLEDADARRHLDHWRADPGAGMDPSNRLTAGRYADLLGAFVAPEQTGLALAPAATSTELPTALPTSLRGIACFKLVRDALGVGRPDRLRQAIDRTELLMGSGGDLVTVQAMVLVAQGRGDVARKLLQPVVTERTGCRTPTSLLEALVIATRLALEAQHPYDAFEYLSRALRTARTIGCYRPLAEAPAVVHDLMGAKADRLSSHRDAVGRIVAYARKPAGRPTVISPLTAREFDVLRELPTLNRVDEIAIDLLVSTNTVKTHIRGIYRKLGVRSRKEAVAEARRLGLLQ